MRLKVVNYSRLEIRLDTLHIYRGYFVMHEMGLAKIYQYTKFELSSFTRSRFTEGVKKI